MKTRRIPTDRPEAAIDALRRGELVAFPTETVYGLGARALDGAAVERIFLAKGRPADNPLIVHLAEPPDPSVARWDDRAQRLSEAFWPGPLTLVLPRGPSVPDVVTAGRDTVAVRMPDHPLALELIRAVGPLAAPSANRSGRPSPTTAEHVLRDLAGRIPWVVDGGPCREGLESTVLDLTGTEPVLLRPGTLELADLVEVLGPIALHPSVARPSDGVDARAPGMRYRHYQPDATVGLVLGDRAVEEARRVAQEQVGSRLLLVTEGPARPGERVFEDGAALGRALYAELRSADDDGIRVVLVAGVESSLALLNRVRKAATWVRER